jgi:hypothetical protein
MNPLGISLIVFACILAGMFLGRVLRDFLPEEQVTGDSKDAIKLGVGLIGTLTAMVLGLMVASAKGTYDTQRNGLAQLSANVIMLDRVLAHYGSDARNVRTELKNAIKELLEQAWGGEASLVSVMEAQGERGMEGRYEVLFDKIQDLPAKNDVQRALKAQALKTATDIGQTRWQMFSQKDGSIPTPFIVVLVFWLTLILACFSLLAPRNMASLVTLLICVLAVSSAVFMVMELDQPFQGLFQISSGPLQNALAQLGR